MSYQSQRLIVIAIHDNYVIGVWMRMNTRFTTRLASLDERAGEFLKTLAYLGGYCTADQARGLELANSPTRVLERLRTLERAGFLRRVGSYPLLYQVTKSVTRMLGTDLMARRFHSVEIVRWRLLAVNFYLEARSWPAEFILDHEGKMSALERIGCPVDAHPQRKGQPYLWQAFILDVHDGGLCASIIDRADCNAFLQTLGFVRRFAQCRRSVGDRLSLVVAVNSEARRRQYLKAATHKKIQTHVHGAVEPLSIYRVSLPVPSIQLTIHRSNTHADNLIQGDHEGHETDRHNPEVLGSQS
jgi:DNA-binding Lrp family transcriptional regulator